MWIKETIEMIYTAATSYNTVVLDSDSSIPTWNTLFEACHVCWWLRVFLSRSSQSLAPTVP